VPGKENYRKNRKTVTCEERSREKRKEERKYKETWKIFVFGKKKFINYTLKHLKLKIPSIDR
jgi:hypothetical protein